MRVVILTFVIVTQLATAQWFAPDARLIRDANMAAGQAAMQKKDFAAAQAAYEAAVALNPYDGYACFQLGSAYLSTAQQDPENIRTGSFYYGRAAILMNNDQIKSWVKRQYTLIHKTPLGLDAYWEFVRNTLLAPKTAQEFPPPPLVPFDSQMFYDIVRLELQGPNSAVFFEDVLKGNRIEKFHGTLVSQAPEQNPKEILLSMKDKGDLRVLISPPLKGKAEPGTRIEIDEATVRGFNKEPFRLDLELNPESMRGWPVAR